MGVEPWGRPYFLPEHYGMPLGTKKPALVFVAPMSDLGHDLVDELWLWEIACAMRAAPQHQYIVLTKRPGPWLRELPPECWVGVSIESDAPEIKARWQQLLGWCWPGAPVKFVSVEPMLGPVSFQFAFKPDWVIVGPETGPKARPCRSEWIDALAAESPVFFDKRKDWKRREYPI
jgi:protein gp37